MRNKINLTIHYNRQQITTGDNLIGSDGLVSIRKLHSTINHFFPEAKPEDCHISFWRETDGVNLLSLN